MHDYYKDIDKDWEKVLPDGIEFCHWGGKAASRRLLDKLDIKPGEKVLDLCCGAAGTLGLANPQARLYGLDISPEATKQARAYLDGLGRRDIQLVEGDARRMPFQDNYFDKIFSQDPDSFMSERKPVFVCEAHRVLKPGATFTLQTYASTNRINEVDKEEITDILNGLGYNHAQTLMLENLDSLFVSNGFKNVEITGLHDMYSEDNLRMLELARQREVKSLIGLLECEKKLFDKGAWTGVLVEAKR